MGGVVVNIPQNIIFQYTAFRDSSSSSIVNYHILYDEQKEVIDKLDLKRNIQVDESTSNLVLKLDVNVYDLSIEAIIFGILNKLFKKRSSINNDNALTNNATVIDDTYNIKELPLKDLIYDFYQFIKAKGHFARDMKNVSKTWNIALTKNHLAFMEEIIQDDEIKLLQQNRIHNNNSDIDLDKHFSIEQTIYNTLHSIETQNADKYYFIYYRIGATNNFYKFVMVYGEEYKELQAVQKRYDYIKIDFEQAIERCSLFDDLEWDNLEQLTKEQYEAIIFNFVLINGGKKFIKSYIEHSRFPIFQAYDWNNYIKIATINANQKDSTNSVKCSKFCPYYEECKPIKDSMIETMRNKRPIEAKEYNVEYTEFYEARGELRKLMERIIL